jgi:hypothetical protein
MASVPTGTVLSIASAFGAAIPTTLVTNATEAVVTATAHGLTNGDIVEVTSGWGRLNLRMARVKASATNTITLEGIDTSNTNIYPAGSGIGSVRKVTTFTQLEGILGVQSNGGDPKNVSYKYVESDVEVTVNDGFTSTTYSAEIDADKASSVGYGFLKSLTEAQSNTCLRMVTRSGAAIYAPCSVALNESVRLQDGQVNRVTCAFNGNNRVTRY